MKLFVVVVGGRLEENEGHFSFLLLPLLRF